MELCTRSKSSLARGCLNALSIYLVIFSTFTAFTTLMAHVDELDIDEDLLTYSDPLVELNEDNWQSMLHGEWMVEFFAPWCPACKNLAPTWERFAKTAKELHVSVAKIDVTTSPSLSGRFFVTALPTIYHVKEGEFRQYRGSRDGDALMLFLKQKQWNKIEPISAWKKPDTIHMSILSYFFKLSHTLKDFNVRLQEEYGLPTWGSYALFAIGTIFVGAALGLLLVCVVDFLYPPKKSQRQSFSESKGKSAGSDAIEDLAADEIEDENDLIDEQGDDDEDDEDDDDEQENENGGAEDEDDGTSEGEKNSNASESDEPESEKDAKKSAGDGGAQEQTTIEKEEKDSKNTSPVEVRKRKPRKAD
ncbi:PREDICTED: thioredoxin-related transmembrane protein 1 [Rhagoletis zephyria]|uniref:thioredoxin-related transmembrane protein 1 n=1 Tax=Rhagoletis zephyria TaxID=28612 RepID=UPI000811A145|nr:PREDICTED: thioredoxin-related transmembrane protein 1 [Rhagoletis zephyria]XP_036334288.1 thioredoxin-related transmembrane protein 1 [Rhagoletis pomonella]